MFLALELDVALAAGQSDATPSIRRLVSAMGESGAAEARAVLAAHLDHPDLETADAILDALLVGGPVSADQRPAVNAALAHEADRLAEILAAVDSVGSLVEARHLRRALADEAARSRHRAIGLLGLLHDPTTLARTVGMLESSNGDRPLALETLEVTVGRAAFPLAVALIDPIVLDADRRDRLRALGFATAHREPVDALIDLIEDPRRLWRDAWLRACALHALASCEPDDSAACGRRR